MNVPMLDLHRQYAPLKKQVFASWERLYDAGSFILGKEVESFEKEIAEYLGVKHALGVNSGTDALTIALKALGLKPGDKVLTSPFTFFGTVSAIANAGVEPVFADICPETFNIDPKAVEEKISKDKRIRAVMPIHLYGYPANMNALTEIARAHGVYVVEDAAQAVGTRCGERRVGGFGDFATFSFYPTKNLGALGDAGLIATNNERFYEAAKLLRNHGAAKTYHHDVLGGNYRIDALQAAALRVFLPHLDSWIEKRRKIANYFNSRLATRRDLFDVRPLPEYHTYHQYTVRVLHGARDSVKAYLQERGIASMVYYPIPCHKQKALEVFGRRDESYPHTEKATQEVLSLPIFPEMTKEEMEQVADTLLSWKR